MRQVRSTLAMLLGVVLLAAGCANIPEGTQPEVVVPGPPAGKEQQVPKPEAGLSPLSVVREFIEASGNPVNDHGRARVYLDKAAKKKWRPGGGVQVINDSYNTVYVPADEQPKAGNERVVLLTGSIVGRLSSDSAFIPATTDNPLEVKIRLRQLPNGEWRIVDAPSKIIITKSDFKVHYFRVPVYFFAPGSATLVPDLRYVPTEPSEGLSGKVVDLLLSGPSKALAGAVRNPLGDKVALETNVRVAPGAVVIPLSGVQDKGEQARRLIVAQLVSSLSPVTSSGIRPTANGAPLIAGHESWRASDLPSYSASSSLSSELSGLFVLNGRVRSLENGAPISGTAGTGSYQVVSAGQSIDGARLAVVERVDGEVRLRVGPTKGALQLVDLAGRSMTAPTWRPSSSPESPSHAVWTVVDGKHVVTVLRTPEGAWVSQAVNASALTSLGTITALRLSRDGTRVAAVVEGNVVIASVVRESSSVTLRAPRVLQSDTLTEVVDVAWAGQHTVVVVTSSSTTPVVRLPIDGLRMEAYDTSNLSSPMRAVAAVPGRPVIAAGQRGMYTASDVGEIWQLHPESRQGAIPFYPG